MVAAAILLGLVWAELLPAVTRLGEIVLWQVSVEREGKTVLDNVSVLALLGALAAAAADGGRRAHRAQHA
jgi:small-conductance mechanosensitive channel